MLFGKLVDPDYLSLTYTVIFGGRDLIIMSVKHTIECNAVQ